MQSAHTSAEVAADLCMEPTSSEGLALLHHRLRYRRVDNVCFAIADLHLVRAARAGVMPSGSVEDGSSVLLRTVLHALELEESVVSFESTPSPPESCVAAAPTDENVLRTLQQSRQGFDLCGELAQETATNGEFADITELCVAHRNMVEQLLRSTCASGAASVDSGSPAEPVLTAPSAT